MTSGVLLGWENLLDAGTVTASSEVGNLSAQKLQAPVIADKWRSGPGASAYFTFDLGAVQQVSVIGLLGHNLSAAGTWQIRASATDPTATGSLAIDIAASGTGVFPDTRPPAKRLGQPNGDAWAILSSPAGVRYGRVDLADATLSYIQAGRAVVLDPHEYDIGVSKSPGHARPDGRLIGQSRGGQEYLSRGFRQRQWRFSLEYMSPAEAWTVADAMDELNGLTDDVFLCIDKASPYLNKVTLWGLVKQVAEITQPEFNQMSRTYLITQRL